jgi:type II secretory pathway component GspD/PulD (secretin)
MVALLAGWLAQEGQGAPPAMQGDAPQRGAKVSVARGRLSVDLRRADLHEVLAQIAQQAAIPIVVDVAGRRTISAQFADLELDIGLRRLLQLASLNHTILYTQNPAGAVVIKEVRVFDSGGGGGRATAAAAEPKAAPGEGAPPDSSEEPQPSTAPPMGEQHEAVQRLQEFLGGLPSRTPPEGPAAAEGQDQGLVRALRDILHR